MDIFRRRAHHKRHSLVWRLKHRQLGVKLSTLRYYQNLPLNETIGRVLVASQLTLKRFCPTGEFLIGFNNYCVDVFRFNGTHGGENANSVEGTKVLKLYSFVTSSV